MPPQMESNLMNAALWAKTRQVLGVGGPVGCTPSEDLAAGKQYGEDELILSMELISDVRDHLDDGASARDIAEMLRGDDEVVDRSLRVLECETEASRSVLCPPGIEFVCVAPGTPTGRTLWFTANGHTNTARANTARQSLAANNAAGVVDADTIYIIPYFAAEWDIPMANHAYKKYYKETLLKDATHFIGTAGRLFALLDDIERRLRSALDILPPWREALSWKRAVTMPLTLTVRSPPKRSLAVRGIPIPIKRAH
eukprot:TRINITY_DN11920_c0_g1_i1.p2 TRINITY_DN11920_c0_g1~~TRINITY_DN11920_c0_g1_i1.p2  ORF type:complete len:255 (+),score=86.14 TRINITY_DN11920_c0_g1_i1:64-828(+)